MKNKKILISIIMLFFIISISTIVDAKYVIEYNELIGKVNIDRTPPQVQVTYSTQAPISDIEGVTVTISANEAIKKVDGWELSKNLKELKKTYYSNSEENINISDIYNNSTSININVNNIDTIEPIIKLVHIKNSNTNYENVANKTNAVTFRIKIIENNIKTNNISPDSFVVKSGENPYENAPNIVIKEISQDNEGIVYDIILTDLEEEGLLNLFIKDGIIMDISNRQSKEMEIKSGITIDNSNLAKLTYASQNSEIGWTFGYGNEDIAGKEIINKNPIYKTESLAFRLEGDVDKDFVQVKAYVYTHWGEGSKATCGDTGLIYNYGYNPDTGGYKSMDSNDLVTLSDGNQYFQFGGTSINSPTRPDINGNNPIPRELEGKYPYGISAIIFKLTDYSYYSIVYQIYVTGHGWMETCSDGEEAKYSYNKPMSAIRLALIPKTQKQEFINKWNNDINN